MENEKLIFIARWTVRLLLVCALLSDVFIVTNVAVRFAMSGVGGVVGYYEHIALTGVDVLGTPQAELRRIVRDSTIRILWGYAILFVITAVLLWAHLKLKKHRGGSPGGSPQAGLSGVSAR